MKSLTRLGIVALSLTALLLVGVGTTFASHQPRTDARHATTYGKLTVNITLASGTVWGTVSISPIKKTCKVAKCTYRVKVGTKLKLTQKPVDQTTWPWGGWILNKKNGGFANTLKVKMGKSTTANAVYQLPETLTINITKTSTLWGRVTVAPLGLTCNSSTCTYTDVPQSTNVTLTETATDTSTWPWGGWTLNGVSKGTATTLKFMTSTSSDTVSAKYCDLHC